MLTMTSEATYAVASAACAAVAAASDLKSRRIPNLLTGPALVFGLLLHGLLGGPRELGSSALAGLIAGSIFLLFYLAGGMGAGDVKLMASIGCLAGLRPLQTILMATALVGALFALGIALRRQRLRQTLANAWLLVGHHRTQGLSAHAELHRGNADALRMPFALPVAAGCLASLGLRLWNP